MTLSTSSAKKKRSIPLWAAAFWLLCWEAAARWVDEPILLVSPLQAIQRFFQLLWQPQFWQSVGFSLGHILLGFFLSLALALVLARMPKEKQAKRLATGLCALAAVLFAVCYPVGLGWVGLGGWKLMLPQSLYANYFTAFFGFYPDWFYSADYFGLLPWLFLFWAGYYLHKAVGRRRMEPLRRSVCPALGWMGRHSLLLYLLHQPVIYGVLSAAAVLFA